MATESFALFIFGDGGLTVERDISSARSCMEPIDVENDEYDAVFDDKGRRYVFGVRDGATFVEPTDEIAAEDLIRRLHDEAQLHPTRDFDPENPTAAARAIWNAEQGNRRARKWAYLATGIALGLTVTVALLTLAGIGPFGRDRVESTPWNSGVISDDDRSITVSFVGAVEFPENDPCHIDYSLRVIETTAEVRITVEGREDSGSKACTMAGLSRSLTAELDAPIGERQVVDGHRNEALTITTTGSGVRTLSR